MDIFEALPSEYIRNLLRSAGNWYISTKGNVLSKEQELMSTPPFVIRHIEEYILRRTRGSFGSFPIDNEQDLEITVSEPFTNSYLEKHFSPAGASCRPCQAFYGDGVRGAVQEPRRPSSTRRRRFGLDYLRNQINEISVRGLAGNYTISYRPKENSFTIISSSKLSV